MKILSVDLANFGPFYGAHKFNLVDRGLLLVMGDNQDEPRMDSNGAGKSSIFDGLDWCLWGDNPRGDHVDAMFNEEAFAKRGSKCAVQVSLVNDAGESIEIIRSRTKSKNELTVNVGGEDKTTLDIKETQAEIERVLGLDRDVFHAAVLFGQTDLVHYADATDGKRMEILTKILQLDNIDKCLAAVKDRVKANDGCKDQLRVDAANVDGQIQANRPEDLDAQIVGWIQENQLQQERAQDQIVTKTAEFNQAVEAGGGVDPQVPLVQKQVIDQELAAMQPPPEPPEVEQARQVVMATQSERGAALQAFKSSQATLSKIQATQEGACSECGQPITGEHLQKEATKAYAATQAADQAWQATNSRLEGADQAWQAAKRVGESARQQYMAGREQKVQESARLESEHWTIAQHNARVVSLGRELEQFQADLVRAKAAVNPWQERKEKVEQERYDLERRQGQLQYELGSRTTDGQYLDFWSKAFGPKGLKSYILDSRLQELTDAANEWMGLLTGGTIWVRFEAQKQTRGKKVVNSPDVRVFRWNPDGAVTERSYKSWSGGEKQRISFAIDFGLSRLVARRAQQTYDLLILDEVFRHLDRSGKEAVVEMLQLLAEEKNSLIVVEHDSEFKGQFENRVLVRKKNRRSTIVEEVDVQQKTEAEKDVPGSVPADTPGKLRPRRTPV